MKQERTGRTQSASEHPATHIRVKRSVSPDGRINSLSVEMVSPLDSLDPDEILRHVRQVVASETKVVEAFLDHERADTASESNGERVDATPAKITAIGGMDTQWGRRLFLVFQVNGEATRVFGSAHKLAGVLGSVGMRMEEPEIVEGVALDVPCQVTTGRTEDGRYLTIEKVLPASAT